MTDRANILLVDDQPARLLTYEAILAPLEQNLVRALSGPAALQRLMEMEFAAILLDVSMPEMDGFETATVIRGHPRFEQTPIIFVTGVHVTDFDRLRGYRVGAVDYVYIPIVPEILRGKMQVFVQLYLQRQELARLNQSLVAANDELSKAHAQLRLENTRELQKLNSALEHRNIEMARANAQLTAEIGDRKRAEAMLQEASRRKDEFLAILGHELRNPLAAMHNCVELIGTESVSGQQLEWSRDVLRRQLKHLTRLMDDLLEVSRIAGGRIQLQRETVDLARVVSQAIEMSRPLIDASHHRLVVEQLEEPLFVDGDAVRLTQALDNLLGNAAKFMDDGGTITLSVERQEDGGDWAIIRVRDRGAGIAPQMLDRIFELFAQAESGDSRKQGGLGIGLALVRGLVELHGGTVTAASDGPGRGAEFTIRLPCIDRPAAAAAQPAPATVSTVPIGRRVLIIDDNRDSAEALAMCLRSSGCDVRLAFDGARGVAAALEWPPDAVLLDIGLPDIDGFEVARRLRTHAHLREVALIAMTGYGGDRDRTRAERDGIQRYLVKPIDYQTLVAVLSEQLKESRSREGPEAASSSA